MKTDSRYSITRTYTGAARPQYVARFASQWIGSAPSRHDARIKATSHAFKRALAGLTPLRVIPALSYRLAGASGVTLSHRHVYLADVATNIPEHENLEAVFVNGILLEKGEYFATPSR